MVALAATGAFAAIAVEPVRAPGAGAQVTSRQTIAAKAGDIAVEALEIDIDGERGVKGLRATFRVAAPPDVVLSTLWDVHRFRSIFPDIKSLDVVGERTDEVDAKFTVDAVLSTVTYILRRDVDRQARVVAWKNIGGDLKLVRGAWSVSPVAGDDAVSEVVYTSFVDVGTFVPTGMVRDIAMSKVEQMAMRVRTACAKPPT